MKKTLIIILESISSICVCQTMNWAPLSSEIQGNVVSCLNVYGNKLIASGWFNKAGTLTVQSIAAWDGISWSEFGGVRNKPIYESLTFNNELYVGGSFDSIGNIKAKNIARWDGSAWNSLGTGSDGSIYSLAVYNNELYAAGNFSIIGGVSGNCIARWDGINWNPLGTGMQNNVNDLLVYNNELYAVGTFYSAGGNTSCQYLARWNGSVWNNILNGVPFGNVALIEWNGKLLIGSNNDPNPPFTDTEVWQWDGTSLTLFSKQVSISIRKFLIFNNELYCSGGGGPGTSNQSFVSKWDSINSVWVPVGTGPNYNVYALAEFNGELYCGGRFNTQANSNLNHIGRLTNVSGLQDNKRSSVAISVFPNPAYDQLNLSFESDVSNQFNLLLICNSLGQVLREEKIKLSQNKLNISVNELPNGVYSLKLKNHGGFDISKRFVIAR